MISAPSSSANPTVDRPLSAADETKLYRRASLATRRASLAFAVVVAAAMIALVVLYGIYGAKDKQTVQLDDSSVLQTSSDIRALSSATDTVASHARFGNGSLAAPLLDDNGVLRTNHVETVSVNLTTNVISVNDSGIPERHTHVQSVWAGSTVVSGTSATLQTRGAPHCEFIAGLPDAYVAFDIDIQPADAADWYTQYAGIVFSPTDTILRRVVGINWPYFRVTLNASVTFAKAVWVSCFSS